MRFIIGKTENDERQRVQHIFTHILFLGYPDRTRAGGDRCGYHAVAERTVYAIRGTTGVSVNYSWNNASARVIEAEVTSKIEGLLMSIQGVAHVNSVTYQGGGRVDVLFKKHVNVDAIRFEIASQMRHLYPKLPEGVSYPALSAASSGEQISPILTYTLNAGIPTQQIQRYAEEHIVKQLALIKGVSKVELSGATPYYMEISFDPDKLTSYGIELYEFISAIQTGVTRQNVVGNVTELDHDSVSQQITVFLG